MLGFEINLHIKSLDISPSRASYEDHELGEMVEMDDVMSEFWTDLEHGKTVVEAHWLKMLSLFSSDALWILGLAPIQKQ